MESVRGSINGFLLGMVFSAKFRAAVFSKFRDTVSAMAFSEGGLALVGQYRKRWELLALEDDPFDKTEKLGVNGIKGEI